MTTSKLKKISCQICSGKTTKEYQGLYDDRYGAKGKQDVYICQDCGFGKTTPGLSKKSIGQLYQKHYPLSQVDINKLTQAPTIPTKFIAWFKGLNHTTHWQAKKGQQVLDIGSGSGRSLVEISSIGGTAYGVEPDSTGKTIAKKADLNVYTGFIQDNPFPNQKFDLVTASQVLEHDPDPNSFIKACANKLNKNGQIILSFPNLNALTRHLLKNQWIHWHVPYHLNFFTKKSIQLLAKKNNLKVKKISTTTPNLWTALQIQSLIYKKPFEGKKSFMWSRIDNSFSKNTGNTSFVNRLIKIITNIFILIIATPNRILDLFLLGDSWLVVLEKNEK
ncbi:class I SAM-dependent methyltransferase [bacterium]|nr:class I SAM-dependent methyltransferase [bacterium]